MKSKNNLIRLFIGFVFLSGFLIYYLGYDLESTAFKSDMTIIKEATRVFFALFSSAAMFTLNNGLSYVRADLTSNPFYLIGFWSIHSLAIFGTFATFFLIFQNKIMNYFKIKVNTHKRRYFIWGKDEDVLVLIKNIRLQEDLPHEITILINDRTDSFTEQLEQLKVSHVFLPSDFQKFVTKLNIKSTSTKDNFLILMRKDYDENIRVAIELLKQPIIRNNPKFHMIVNCDHEEWIEEALNDAVVNLKTYNMADLIARYFIQKYPPYNHIIPDLKQANISMDYHVIIIGFGAYGEQILLKLISQSQFYGKAFKATVIEQNHNQNIGKFKRLHGLLIEKYDISFNHIDFDSDEFNHLVSSVVDNLSAIIVCTEDDQLNKNIGLELNQYLKSFKSRKFPLSIYVKNSMPTSFINKIHADVNAYNHVLFFGASEEVLSPDIIINEKLDLLAESIHEFYRSKSNGTMEEWKYLSPFLKDSNRNAALHIFTKLGLVGLKVKPTLNINVGDRIIESKDDFIQYLGPKRMNELAKHEHARWCAFHYIHDWDYQPVSRGVPIKNKALKKHGCLVSWDQLKELTHMTGEDYQASCLDQVVNNFDYLKNIQYVIYEEID